MRHQSTHPSLALFAGLALAAASLTACATTGEAIDRFDQFTAQQEVDFTSYDAVYLAPVQVAEEITDRIDYRPRGATDRIRPLGERDIARNVERLTEEVSEDLAAVTTLVDAPGEGVLTIEITLTDLEAARPTLAELSQEPGLSLQSRALGGASADIVFKEGDKVLATAEDDYRDTDLRDANLGTFTTAYQFYARLGSKLADLVS